MSEVDDGPDEAARRKAGHTALGDAAIEGDVARVRALLEAGETPHPAAGERWGHESPLLQAARGGSGECVRLLLEAGADPLWRDRHGATALMVAGSAEVARVLIAAGLPVDAVDEHDQTALDEAAAAAQLEVMRALVEAGADLERRGRHIGETALHRLCRSFSVDPSAVEVMLDLGADLFAVDRNIGGCALHHAAQLIIGDRVGVLAPVIGVLVRRGLAVDTRDRLGATALFEAVGEEGGEPDAVRALLEHGADPNAVNRRGQTPLMVAACGCWQAVQIVPILIAAGADPRQRAKDGKNAIEVARATWARWQSICASDEQDPEEQRVRHREVSAEADRIVELLLAAAG